MTQEEELQALREENAVLKAQVAELLPLKEQVAHLQEQVKQLRSRLAKDSHNSHLPPSSERFGRKKKTRSLRKRSGKKPGGQAEHPGETIQWCSHPDENIRHAVLACGHCQAELSSVEAQMVEARQLIELPSKRHVVIEHQAEQKWCPQCGEVSTAAFPEQVRARVQYGSSVAAAASLLVVQHLIPLARTAEVLFDLLGVPAVCLKALRHIFGECETGSAGKRDVVVVVEEIELAELQMASQRRGFLADAFHQVSIAADAEGVVIHDVMARPVKTRGEPGFGHG